MYHSHHSRIYPDLKTVRFGAGFSGAQADLQIFQIRDLRCFQEAEAYRLCCEKFAESGFNAKFAIPTGAPCGVHPLLAFNLLNHG
jgi:hypothetical protein